MTKCEGPSAQMVRLYLVFTYIWQKDVAKFLKVQLAQNDLGPLTKFPFYDML